MKRLLIFLILFLPLISANQGFTIELKPVYYLQGQQVIIYNNDSQFDGISFQVTGKNMDVASRIINLHITKISSELLEGKFEIKNETLISAQEKNLWNSEIFDVTQIKDKNLLLVVGVTGTNEVTKQVFYAEGQYILYLNSPQTSSENNSDISKKIGNWIWDGNYQLGLLIGGGIMILLGFLWWRYRVGKKMERWRDQRHEQ